MTITIPTLNIDSIGSIDALNGVPPGMTFTRALGTATRVNARGLIEPVAADILRHDYDPVTKEHRGWLTEGARTNLVIQSEDMNTSWDKTIVGSAVGVTTNTDIAPDGTTTADTITDNAGAGVEGLSQYINIPNDSNPYTFSYYLLKDADTSRFPETGFYFVDGSQIQETCQINTTDGTIAYRAGTNGGITSVENAGLYWRVKHTLVNNTSGNIRAFPIFVPARGTTHGGSTSTNGSIVVWGAQLEIGLFASSYIPTTTVAVTRSADFPLITDLSWFNVLEGAFLVEGININYTPTVSDRIFDIQNGGGPGFIEAVWTGTTIQMNFNNGSDSIKNLGTFVPGTAFNVGISYTDGDIAGSFDGAAVVTDTVSPLPSIFTGFAIGQTLAGTRPMFGHIKSIRYWPSRLTNEELIELTL